MNISLKLNIKPWETLVIGLKNSMAASDRMLKKAILFVWPRESASHFEQEVGFAGPWAPWKESTRRQRISHEIATASSAGIKRARAAGIREGGKLLQMTGKLRTQTMLDPILQSIPNGLKLISPTPYSGYLDEGTSNMEARPFMWLGDDAQELLGKLFLDGLMERVGGTE